MTTGRPEPNILHVTELWDGANEAGVMDPNVACLWKVLGRGRGILTGAWTKGIRFLL